MATQINLADSPATKEYLKNFYETVFRPLLLGQSNALFNIPKSGANSLIKYIINYHDLVEHKYSEELKDKLYVFIELERASTIFNLYQNILSQLPGNTEISVQDEASLRKLVNLQITEITKQGKNVIFICNNSEVLLKEDLPLFNILLSLYSINTSLVNFIMLFNLEYEESELLKLATQLGVQKLNYIKLRKADDIRVLLEKEMRWYNYSLKPEVVEKIVSLAGGYSALARGLLIAANEDADHFLSLTNQELLSLPNIRTWFWKIYSSLQEKSKEQLRQTLVNNSSTEYSKFIVNTGIVANKKFFSPLMKDFLNLISKDSDKFNEAENTVTIYNIPVENILSPQEFLVFMELWGNKGKVVSRSEMAKVMWGNNYSEKYSDWSIDKTISRIRIKLSDKEHIQTEMGKGFKWI